jgi:hypothetical protein
MSRAKETDAAGWTRLTRAPAPVVSAYFEGTGRVPDAVNGGSDMAVSSFPGLALEWPGVAVYRSVRLPWLPENRSR